jgi:hypothetical protein
MTDTLAEYRSAESFTVERHGSHAVLDFCSEVEPERWEEGEGRLGGLVSLRADILHGDYRAPYLGWLLDVQEGLIEDGVEPPVPPGLGELSAPLQALAEFLRLEDDLVEAAAQASEPMSDRTPESDNAWRAFVKSLSPAHKDKLLCRLGQGDASVAHELRRRFGDYLNEIDPKPEVGREVRRSVADLLAARNELLRRRRERAARDRARRRREAEAARRAYLTDLAGREDGIRRKIAQLIDKKQPKAYDQAVELLVDLRDAAPLRGQEKDFDAYLAALREQHARKVSLMERLDKRGL